MRSKRETARFPGTLCRIEPDELSQFEVHGDTSRVPDFHIVLQRALHTRAELRFQSELLRPCARQSTLTHPPAESLRSDPQARCHLVFRECGIAMACLMSRRGPEARKWFAAPQALGEVRQLADG